MADRDYYLLPVARLFFEGRSESEQQELREVLENICRDPLPDGELKLRFPISPLDTVLYHDGRFYAVFDHENNWTLAIWDLGYDDSSDSWMTQRPTR